MLARWIDADVVLRAGRNRRVQGLIGAAFVFYLLYHLTRFQFAQMWPIVLVGDAAILFESSRDTFTRAAYPDGTFPYSPSAVILFRRARPRRTDGLHAWLVRLMAAGLVVSVRAALTQERAEIRAAWPLIGAVAVILAGSPISWDLRNANSNLVYLGLVMAGYALAGRRPVLAGMLVGLSVSLKLYSGLLMAWLMVNGPRRMFYAGAAAMVILWIVLPLALVWPRWHACNSTRGWREQVAHIADLTYHTATGCKPRNRSATGHAAQSDRQSHRRKLPVAHDQCLALGAAGNLACRAGLVRMAVPALPARRGALARGAGGLDRTAARAAAVQPLARALSRDPTAGRRDACALQSRSTNRFNTATA